MHPLLTTAYFPPVQYFAWLNNAPKAQLEAQENYGKGSYRNRCHIASVNGVQRLSVPLLKGKNQQQNIREVRISFAQAWRPNHWHAIRSAYGNSPFFEHYGEQVEVFFKGEKFEFLWDFNQAILQTMLRLLGIKVEVSWTETYQKEPLEGQVDLRTVISPKSKFTDPAFLPTTYPQVFTDRHGFLPDLSILDLLFCTGPAAKSVLDSSIVSH